jgi:hypothetical protein
VKEALLRRAQAKAAEESQAQKPTEEPKPEEGQAGG